MPTLGADGAMAREEDANWLAEEPEEVEDCGFPPQRPPEEQQRSVRVKLKGAIRKREGKQAARASRSNKVPELSDEEAQKLADEQGVHLLVTGSKSGFFGVYAKGGRFHASVRAGWRGRRGAGTSWCVWGGSPPRKRPRCSSRGPRRDRRRRRRWRAEALPLFSLLPLVLYTHLKWGRAEPFDVPNYR